MVKKGDIVKVDGNIQYKIQPIEKSVYAYQKIVMLMDEPYGTKLTNTEYALVLDLENKMKGIINTKDIVEILSEADA